VDTCGDDYGMKLKDYLIFAKYHYSSLADLMEKEGKERYANEHRGKVKFIELLLLKLEGFEKE